MLILNYTTKIDCWKTINEIQQVLSKHNVSHFSIKNENGNPIALSFAIECNSMPLNFLLPCNFEGFLQCLKNDRKIPSHFKNKDQALRTSWRILKDWVAAQLALVDARLAPIQEVFLQYMIVNQSGETLANKILHGDGFNLLTDAS